MICADSAADQSFVTPATRALFPLRLTPFEYYMYLDGRLGNSMAFFLQLEVEGTVDRQPLQQAVAFASGRHPLVQATITSGRWGGTYWSLAADKLPQVLWTSGQHTPSSWATSPDLTCEVGLRILVEQRDADATITAQFHHACCDGAGALQWLEDLLAWYAKLTGSSAATPEPAEIQPERLLDRRRRRLDSVRGWKWITKGAHEIYKFFCQVPQPLGLPDPPPSVSQPPFAGMVSHQFTTEQTQHLRRAAHEQGVTLNEILLRDLFVTIADWNASDEPPSRRNPWYRITMPTSLRERADTATPAANLMAMTFLNRRRSVARLEKGQLLADVHRESEEIKRTRRGTLFLDGLAIVHAVPGLLPLILRVPWCMSTAVLTNLGDPTRRSTARFPRRDGKLLAGNLLLQRIDGVPPLRPHTHAAIGVNTYLGRLSLSLQMTPGLFSLADTQRFLALYVRHITSSCP